MDLLQVKRDRIVDSQGLPVKLRGVCLGGWMNMENFINGYPGAEHGLRAAMQETLGPNLTRFFFERWLDQFLTEKDIAFIRQTGANVVRLALNYRHFEKDSTPFYYEEAGFERLDRAVQWCARHGLYAILDLHAAQGWQNPDWHSDNANGPALFWDHPHFQDRFIALWQELATRYAGNPVIAGYDLLNEPHTQTFYGSQPRWEIINTLYRRAVAAIRASDTSHIIFLEGDGFAARFDCLDAPFADNLVYAGHSYSPACFGPGPYPGLIGGKHWDRAYLTQSNHRHQLFPYAAQHQVPFWVGEFGALCNGPAEEQPCRLTALDDQLAIFEQAGAHWTAWTYKDMGIMGWVTIDPESDYAQIVAPILQAKAELATDSWSGWMPESPVRRQARDLADAMHPFLDTPDLKPEANYQHVTHALFSGYAANALQRTFARRFKGMNETQIDCVLQSFSLEQCRPRQELLAVLGKYMDA